MRPARALAFGLRASHTLRDVCSPAKLGTTRRGARCDKLFGVREVWLGSAAASAGDVAAGMYAHCHICESEVTCGARTAGRFISAEGVGASRYTSGIAIEQHGRRYSCTTEEDGRWRPACSNLSPVRGWRHRARTSWLNRNENHVWHLASKRDQPLRAIRDLSGGSLSGTLFLETSELDPQRPDRVVQAIKRIR